MPIRKLLCAVNRCLASLRLAVALMLGLALTCVLASLYESRYGTAAVQSRVYRTYWFGAILTLLGLNVLASMVKRYPWTRRQIGFVMAHLGILAILVGSLVSLHVGMDGNMQLHTGETSDRVTLLEKSLQVIVPGHAANIFRASFEQLAPAPQHQARFPLIGSDLTLITEDYLPHAEVTEDYRAAEGGPPAMHFLVVESEGTQEGWLSLVDPSASTFQLDPILLSLHPQASPPAHDAIDSGQGIAFFAAPSGSLTYAITGNRPILSRAVSLGDKLDSPWAGTEIVVDRFLPHSAAYEHVSAVPSSEDDEQSPPAVKVHLEERGRRFPSVWVPWAQDRNLPMESTGGRVAFRAPEVLLPFRVTLLACHSEIYPGSAIPAAYDSWLRIEDPERGPLVQQISMNHPLHYRGYTFFQGAFVGGDSPMMIFFVAASPGLPIVYGGTVFVVGGVFWMFYLKSNLMSRAVGPSGGSVSKA